MSKKMKEADSLKPGGTMPLGKTPPAAKSTGGTPPPKGGSEKKGYFPGGGLSGPEQQLATELQDAKKAIIVQSPKGDFLIRKNNDGSFSVDKSQFSQMVSPRRMMAPDVVDAIAKNAGQEFRIMMKESDHMNIEIVKKDLLRRKVQEHFTKHPKEKTIIVSTNIGEQRTVWKVDRTKNGFNVVEVNTKKEKFVLEALPPPGQPPTGMGPGKTQPLSPTTGAGRVSEDQFRKMDFNSKFMMLQNQTVPAKVEYVAATVADLIDPTKKALVANLRQLFQGPAKNISAVALFTELSQQPNLMTAGKKNAGKTVKEADDKKDEKKPEKKEEPKKDKEPAKKEKSPEPKPEMDPGKEIGSSGPDAGGPMPAPEDAGLETSATPPEQPEAPEGEEPPADAPKTGEEMQLKHVVNTKPIKDIQVFGDDMGGHVMLSLGGLKNPLQINFSPDGKITYKLGELSRVLKVGK